MMKFGKPKTTARPGTDRRWTLLFIGDHGNVITLKRFKAIVLTTAFVFLLTIGAMAVLIFLNAGFQKENQEFKKRIADSQKRIETLRHEKEILMARLVLSESKMKESVSKGQQGRVQENITKQIEEKAQAAPKLEKPKINKKKPPIRQPAQTVSSGSEIRDNKPVFSVAVENFIVSHASDRADLNAQFKIKNTSPESQKVAGHAVVVLKSKELPKHKWLVMPAVGLVGDKPSGKSGKRFSIQRFRTMNLTSKTPKHSDKFRTAAVYVYLKSGKLLLEEDFPVELPALPVAEKQTSSVSAPSTKTHSVDRLTTQAPSNETPSTEISPIDDSADSFENAPLIY